VLVHDVCSASRSQQAAIARAHKEEQFKIMADDDGQQVMNGSDDASEYSNGFANYEEQTVDPGPWLLLGTTVFCVSAMLILMPIFVWRKLGNRKSTSSKEQHHQDDYVMVEDYLIDEDIDVSAKSVLKFDKETKSLLKLAVPFTISSLASTVFSTLCFIIISHNVTTLEITAYAIVCVFVGLTDGIMYGPISSCTTLCAHAVGAGNVKLAGTYLQLAVLLYVSGSALVFAFWWFYMYEAILWLEWGDEATALLGQSFIRHYMWNYMLAGISASLWQLLEIADHVKEGTYISILWGLVNVVVMSVVQHVVPQFTLVTVAWVYNGTALLFVLIAYAMAERGGWLKPFKQGLFHTFSLKNGAAIKRMVQQAIPLSIGYFFSSADWAILTFMASHLGPAEVAAWAILGSIWDLLYYTTCGIADSGEIRVAKHLGDNCPKLAQLAAFKALLMGMVIGIITSVLFFCLQDQIPGWYTHDETLTAMLRELVPFVGVANLSMTFGMQCWSLIGAQGKYKVATWVSFISSWGVTMPLAAIFVYVFFIDLQGLMAAMTIGYTSCGATLSYLLLSTDWEEQAHKIQERNADVKSGAAGEDTKGDDAQEELYASLQVRGAASHAVASRGIRQLVVPVETPVSIANVGLDSSDSGSHVAASQPALTNDKN
jgi:MATE family multidrug resistance protein